MPVKATLDRVLQASDGRMVPVEGDVFDVVARIREVDPSLGVQAKLFLDDDGKDAVMFRITEDSVVDGVRRDRTVCWVEELTPDLPDYLRMIAKMDFPRELERLDALADRLKAHRLHERVGPIGERLAFAMRRDRGYDKQRAFITRDIL